MKNLFAVGNGHSGDTLRQGVPNRGTGSVQKFTVIYASEVPWKRNPNKLAAKIIDFKWGHLAARCPRPTSGSAKKQPPSVLKYFMVIGDLRHILC
jgi:hypothetical protein